MHKVFKMRFAGIYQAYVNKVERKGRHKAELDEVIAWLTGYRGAALDAVVAGETDVAGFFAGAPEMNPDRAQVTGVVCGVRVETVEDPLMREIRVLDKLVDELAKGKALDKVMRAR